LKSREQVGLPGNAGHVPRVPDTFSFFQYWSWALTNLHVAFRTFVGI
jgi:hypothetical protein